jgi:signal transduction histidine kinase
MFILLVALFNVVGWYLYFVVKNSKEDELGNRLITVANMVSSYLESEAVIISFTEGDEQTDWYKRLKEYLLEVKKKNNLRTLSIFNTDFQWMIGTDANMKIGTYSYLLKIDEEEIKKSITQKVSTQSYLYSFEDIQYKRAYAPIQGFDGTIEAFVKVEASRDYFVGLAKLRNSLIFLGLFCISVIGILVIIFYKLVNALIKAEESSELNNRLQSLGTMAAGVAHEIRNPLGIIRNTAEILKAELLSESDSYSYVDSILEEVHRLNNLVTQFLQLSKPSVIEKRDCDIRQLIESTISFVKYDFEKSGIKNFYDKPQHPVNINCDENSIKQLLLNLLINAKQSMKNGGAVKIDLIKKKNKILITITDEGSGISEIEIKKVFDPFYSTKDAGIGLGLTICKNIVDSHNGTIEVFSRENKGTKVVVRLPIE